MKPRILATAFGLLGILGFSSAQGSADLQAAFDQGNYSEVYDQAMALATADGYALAARAGTNYALYKAANMDEQTKWFDQAIAAADKALEADSENALANFAWGEAQGRKAIVMMEQQGIGGMLRNPSVVGVIRPMRERAEKAIELDPQLADAYILLGLWHVAIASQGVGFLYGANMDKGVDYLGQAIEVCEQSSCNRMVTGVKEHGYGLFFKGDTEGAIADFQRALELPAETFEAKQEQARAKLLLEGAQQGKKAAEVKIYTPGAVTASQ